MIFFAAYYDLAQCTKRARGPIPRILDPWFAFRVLRAYGSAKVPECKRKTPKQGHVPKQTSEGELQPSAKSPKSDTRATALKVVHNGGSMGL